MVRLEQRLSLQQKLSPQQVLFSTLLQMPVMALEQKIKLELEQNPLLDEIMDAEVEQEEKDELPDPMDEEMKDDDKEEVAEPEEKDDFDIDDYMNDEDKFEIKTAYKSGEEEDYRPDPAPVSLAEHLLSQFHFLQLNEEQSRIGEYIIWNINEDGYLSTDADVLAENLSLPPDRVVTEEDVEKILAMIQTLDPVGIGSRNLQECLIVQLREEVDDENLSLKILTKHYDDFKNKRFEKLIKNLNVTIDDIKVAIERISKLNPKPGEGYINTNENYIVPDLIVEKIGHELIVSVNEGNIPQLRINNAYRKMLTDGSNITDETKRYIHHRIESARWLINSIQQRKITMIKVMKEIIHRQTEFFDKGNKFLTPMILKDIAEAISMDISTISRVTNGKYVQTDYGVYELKYFFTDKMMTDSGDEISTMRIKNQIKEIIETEDPKKPLNDGQLAQMVTEKGIPIARRTVAKYREQMMIPVARLRRKI